MVKSSKLSIILTLLSTALLAIVLTSACNVIGIGGGEEGDRGPAKSNILAPQPAKTVEGEEEIVKALIYSTVQIQSEQPGRVS